MLNGIRILEFEGLGPAPFAGHMLAEMGADVVVIHRRGAPVTPGMPNPNPLDTGKRSIMLDLKDPVDLAVAQSLAKQADALIEGARPGVMERLGLGPETLCDANPKLVYGRMTGWGQTGPRAQQSGHDLTYLAASGALFYAGAPGQVPGVPPTVVGDIAGGALYLVAGVLAGLLSAGRTGFGTVVDAAILDGAAHMMGLLASLGPGFSRSARGVSLLDGPHWSRCYTCACGGHVAVQCLEPKFYAEFLRLLGLSQEPALAVQFDPVQWPDQTQILADLFAGHSRDHWAAVFEGSEACVAPVLSPDEAKKDPQVLARGIWPADMPQAAPRFAGYVAASGALSARGADRKTILKDWSPKTL